MLSGLSREADIVRGFAAGATDYLTKPLSADELLAKVSVLLARAGRATQVVPGGDTLPGGREAAFGRYRLEGLLGQGAFGVVFRAFDQVTRRPVALKVLAAMASMQPETRMRFLRETYALGTVKHGNVAGVHDFGAAEGRLYYTMDLIPGVSIDEKTRGAVATEADARGLLRGLALGLGAIAAHGIVHRDLKPANVILRDGDWRQPVIVDFGLAKQPFDRGLTDPEMIIGTPAFMSPETILGKPLDPRSDIFSLGLLVRFALVGADAFPQLGGLPLLKALATRPVDLPRTVSVRFARLLRRMVEPSLERRTPSAQAIVDALDRLALEEPV
jgi:serine/threonine-protein kinase